MIKELSDDENIAIMVKNFGCSEREARLVIEIERGDSDGDVVDQNGNAITPRERIRRGMGALPKPRDSA